MTKDQTTKMIKWIITFVITFAIFLVPTNDIITMEVKLFVAITLFNIMLMAFEFVPVMVPALMLPLMFILFNVVTPAVAFKSWSSQTPWIVIGSFILSAVMVKTRLSYRLTYWCLSKAKGNYKKLMYATVFAGFILAGIVPAAIARMAVFCTIMMGFCEALGFEPKSKEAACSFIIAFLAAAGTKTMFLTGGSANILAVGVLETYGYTVTWLDYFWYNLPHLLFALTMTFLALKIFKPEVTADSSEYINGKLAELGKMGSAEKKTTAIVLFTFVMLLTAEFHGLQTAWIFLIAGLLCFMPGINLADENLARGLNWPMVIMITSTACIGDVASTVGAGNALVHYLLPIVPESTYGLYIFFWALGMVCNLAMTPLAAVSALVTPIIELSIGLGLNPVAPVMTMITGTAELIFPYEIAYGILLFGYGMISMKDFVRFFSLKVFV